MNLKVRLRDLEPGDLPLFFEHQRDPEAVAMAAAFRSRDAAAFDQHWEKLLANPEVVHQTIVVDEQAVGYIMSFLRDDKREVGYWIDRTFWGHGIASAALSAFVRLDQTRPLYAGVASHNLASLRVLQKCGFSLPPSLDEESRSGDDSLVLLALLPEM
jgi:RimJ/RimL family protein N-acetyltransferase